MDGKSTITLLKVLYVEDSEHDALAVQRVLKNYNVGFDITHCFRGEEAIRRLDNNPTGFDILLADYILPGMNGLELCNTLLERHVDLPLVILTGTGSETVAVEALKSGVSDYLVKDPHGGYLKLLPIVLVDAVKKHADRIAGQEAELTRILLEKTFSCLGDAIFVIDPRTRTTITVNPAVEHIFGYKENKIVGVNTAFLHVDELAYKTFGAALFRALDAEGIYHTEYTMRRKDGTVFATENTVTEIKDKSGERTQVISVVRDISERKKSEKALRDAHDELERRVVERTESLRQESAERKQAESIAHEKTEQFELMFNSMAEGVVTITSDGMIETVNPMIEQMFGYSQEELSGQNVKILMPEPDQSKHDGYLSKYSKTGEKKIIGIGREVLGKCKDGTIFPLNLSVNEFVSEGVTNYIGTLHNLTIQKAAERGLIFAKQSAESSNRSKSELLANMSHELRTPLNAIIGFSGSMKAGTFGPVGSDKNREYLNDIHQSGQHLLRLINDILDVSTIEAGALELEEENVNLTDVVETSIRLIRPRADKGQVGITSTIDSEIPLIYADARRAKQVFLNLLSNAVKFTPEGGEVTVSAHLNEDGSLAVVVADNGIGMDEEEVAKALTTFRQVDSGLDRKHEGSGLGLPLTKGLMELHGGTLKIRSEKGHGSMITVVFPKERVIQNV